MDERTGQLVGEAFGDWPAFQALNGSDKPKVIELIGDVIEGVIEMASTYPNVDEWAIASSIPLDDPVQPLRSSLRRKYGIPAKSLNAVDSRMEEVFVALRDGITIAELRDKRKPVKSVIGKYGRIGYSLAPG